MKKTVFALALVAIAAPQLASAAPFMNLVFPPVQVITETTAETRDLIAIKPVLINTDSVTSGTDLRR